MNQPLRIALAALALVVAGGSAWFWLQMSAPAPLATATQARAEQEPQRETARESGHPPESSASQALEGEDRSVRPTPAATRRIAARPAKARAAGTAVEEAPSPRPARSLRRVAESSAATIDDSVQRDSRAEPAIHPLVAAGYAAYRADRLAEAREAYTRALHDEPGSRDALLGLAAVEMRLGHVEAAEDLYARRLQGDPRDAHAQAGLLALRGAQADPIASETRIKMLLVANPQAHALHFALGNQYAQQGRWAEAREAYLRAYGADSENADFAYNLAVSLDHLRQSNAALEHYRRALGLAAKHSVAFDLQAAELRAQQLAQVAAATAGGARADGD